MLRLWNRYRLLAWGRKRLGKGILSVMASLEKSRNALQTERVGVELFSCFVVTGVRSC
jgi:hypothetical protein